MEKDTISEAVEEFNEAEEHWADQFEQSLDDLKFARLGDQWDDKTKEERARAARPCLTINRLPSFARQVVNDARQNKPAIKCYPVDDRADPETAEILNGVIRNIEYNSSADVAYDTALESAVYCGMGYFRIDVDYASYDSFDYDIKINRIVNPLNVLPDISSESYDASDWNKCFIHETMHRDDFKKQYSGADPIDFKSNYNEHWRFENEVRIAERWIREEVETELLQLSSGDIVLSEQFLSNQDLFSSMGISVVNTRPTKTFNVTQQIMTAAEVLEENEWAGRYIPIIPTYGEEFFIEGRRYFKSMFHDAKDSQRMFNFWRTATTETVALAPKSPYVGAVGQFDTDGRNWGKANVDNIPYLEYDQVDGAPPPQRQPPPQIPAGAIQETMSAEADMKSIIGIHDAGLGAQSNEISGVAIDGRKVESDTSNFHFMDNLSRSMKYAGKVLLDLIPNVYSEPRMMRIIGHDGSTDQVQINKEFNKGGRPQIFDLTKGKYDVTVDVGASYQTKRKESVANMMQLASSHPHITSVIGDLIAKNMDWDGSEEIAKRLKALLPPQILAMEELDSLPEEAKAIVSNLQAQAKQLQQQLQQKDMILAEYDQAVKVKDQQLSNKQAENEIKMAKIQSDERIKQIEDKTKKDLEIFRQEVKALIEGLNMDVGQPGIGAELST